MWCVCGDFQRENGGGGGSHSIFFLLMLKRKIKLQKQQEVFIEHKFPPIMANSKDQKTNILKPVERSCHKKCPCAIYEKSDIYHFEIMTNAIF